jgi:hypothetical protein
MDLKNPVKGQFALLKALCIGRTADLKAFEMELSSVVVNYPKEPVKDRAQEILDYIRGLNNQSSGPKTEETKNSKSKTPPSFKVDLETEHLFVLVFAAGQANPSQTASVFSDFNSEYFNSLSLTTNPVPLSNGDQSIVVRLFPNAQKAMSYFAMFGDQLAAQREMSFEKQFFVISKANYAVWIKSVDTESYLSFFEKEYSGLLESAKSEGKE